MTEAVAAKARTMRGISAIPEGWDVVPLKTFLRLRSERENADLPLLSVYRDHGVVPFGSIDGNHNKPSLDLSGYKTVRVGDLVLNKMKTWQGSLAVSGHEGIVSPAYVVCKVAGDWDRRYLHHLLRSPSFIAEYASLSYGVRVGQWDMRFDDFREVIALRPPVHVQRDIVTFLDSETARIDSLIDRKQRFIELLLEKRTALITRAVTKGLDSSVEMKNSGSPFLPDVPAQWSVHKLGYLTRKVADGPHFSPSYVDDGVMFISARNIKTDRWAFEDAEHVSEDDYTDFCRRIIPERGDVLYTKGGTTGIARAVDFDDRFQVWVHVAVLKLWRNVNPFWLAYALNSGSAYTQSQLYTRGATNNDLGLTRLINITLAVPSGDAQQEIVSYLDAETAKLNTLVGKTRTSIELLKEYRIALISAAVTGQIEMPATDIGEDVA